MKLLNNTIEYLQHKNHKAFYLAVMRVFFGFFLLKEILLKLSSAAYLYGSNSIFRFTEHSSFIVFGIDITTLQEHYVMILSIYILAIILFIFGIGKRFTAFLIFFLILILQKLNNSTVNGGDKMARLLIFYFAFANSFEYFCLKKTNTKVQQNTATDNLISNLAAYSIMIQLCFAYFITFLNKFNNSCWFNGTAIYYVFQTEAYQGTHYNQLLTQSKLFVYVATYFALIFEGCFAFLIWFKKLRIPLLIGGLMLHFGIYFFMMIYNLQIVFLLPYGLFFSNQEVILFFKNKLRLNFLLK